MFGNNGGNSGEGSGKKLGSTAKEAMLKVCKEIMGEMDGMMGQGLDAKKAAKVTVMADSKPALEEGLEQAEDVVEGDESDLDSLESEAGEIDVDALSENEIDELLEKLMAAKEQKKVKAPF